MSPDANAPHAGAAEIEPFPVCVMNFFVVVVLPASKAVVSNAL